MEKWVDGDKVNREVEAREEVDYLGNVDHVGPRNEESWEEAGEIRWVYEEEVSLEDEEGWPTAGETASEVADKSVTPSFLTGGGEGVSNSTFQTTTASEELHSPRGSMSINITSERYPEVCVPRGSLRRSSAPQLRDQSGSASSTSSTRDSRPYIRVEGQTRSLGLQDKSKGPKKLHQKCRQRFCDFVSSSRVSKD